MSSVPLKAISFKTILNFYCCRYAKFPKELFSFKTILNFYCCRYAKCKSCGVRVSKQY